MCLIKKYTEMCYNIKIETLNKLDAFIKWEG